MKPKLIPLRVPWQVSPSTPYLGLTLIELVESKVEFASLFWSEEKGFHGRAVTVTFRSANWFRVSPSIAEGRVIREEAYDWSEVEFHNFSVGNVERWLQEFKAQWKATGICPYPRAYEVQNSEWLASLPVPSSDWLHLLFLGDEMYVEVIAKGWNWKAGQEIGLVEPE